MRNHSLDINLINDAKRCINIADILSGTVHMFQSIPAKISCWFFGQCEASNDVNDNNDGGNNANDNAVNDNDVDEEGEPDEDNEDDPDEGEPEEGPEEGPGDGGPDDNPAVSANTAP